MKISWFLDIIHAQALVNNDKMIGEIAKWLPTRIIDKFLSILQSILSFLNGRRDDKLSKQIDAAEKKLKDAVMKGNLVDIQLAKDELQKLKERARK